MGPTIGDISDDELVARAGTMLLEILRRTHLSPPHELSAILAEEARTIGLAGVVVYLVDYEQQVLVPVPGPDSGDRQPVPVGASVAGRSYAAVSILDTAAADGRRVWLPLLDGTERLGVLEVAVSGYGAELSEHALAVVERFAHFAAGLVVMKDPYTDVFKRLRRRRAPTTGTEQLRAMVPPSTMTAGDFVLSAVLEPAYDLGGDAYDYALNDETLHLAIFDGIGHGLAAAGVTSFALSVYRHSRRLDEGLQDSREAIDVEVAAQYAMGRYVTGCMAQLDVGTGRLRWVNAGHPAPLLLRGGRFVKELDVQRTPPMGLRLTDQPATVGEEQLEPGDMVLFYTDGLTEARRPDGRLFTTERLTEFIERQAGGGEAAPDTLRRLRDAIIERGEGSLRDDATAMLLEWRRGTQARVVPETVLEP